MPRTTGRLQTGLNLTFGLRVTSFIRHLLQPTAWAGNFDPSIARTGRLIYPAGYASTLDVQELANVNACPDRRC